MSTNSTWQIVYVVPAMSDQAHPSQKFDVIKMAVPLDLWPPFLKTKYFLFANEASLPPQIDERNTVEDLLHRAGAVPIIMQEQQLITRPEKPIRTFKPVRTEYPDHPLPTVMQVRQEICRFVVYFHLAPHQTRHVSGGMLVSYEAHLVSNPAVCWPFQVRASRNSRPGSDSLQRELADRCQGAAYQNAWEVVWLQSQLLAYEPRKM